MLPNIIHYILHEPTFKKHGDKRRGWTVSGLVDTELNVFHDAGHQVSPCNDAIADVLADLFFTYTKRLHRPRTSHSSDCTDHILAILKQRIKSLSISKTFRQTRHHKSNLRVTSNVKQYRYKTVYFWCHSSHNIWRESGANQLTEVYFRNNWTSQWCSCVGRIVETESITNR